MFIALAVAMFLGMLANPYAGLVVFVGLPVIFMMGLLLIPVGMRLQRKALAEGRGVGRWPVIDLRQTRTRRVALTIAIADRHQHRHRPGRRLRLAASGWNRRSSAGGVPRADAPAVHGLAERLAFERHLRPVPYR